MNFTSTPEGALIVALALAALMLIVIALVTSRGARARHAEKARAWAALKAPEWQARAARKRARRESGERANARLRVGLMSAVALVAVAATNLSAHATINAMQRVGLHSIDTAISVVVVFEAFLAILGALSLWHMTKGTGFNWYEAGVWSMASLMGVIAWWGGNSPIFALWPLLAAVAWHVVITFGREHKQSALVTWWRLKRGKATSQDANAVMTERLITQIVNTAFAANEGARILRALNARLYDRAWARADALGILTPEVRARIQTRIAARYAGASALARDAVAHMNPWNERAQSARTARTVRPVSAPPAPALEVSAHEVADERAPETERAIESAPVSIATDIVAAIREHFAGPSHALEWAIEFAKTNGELPTGDDLARAFEKTAGNCRKWMTPVRKALGY
jgi:cell pole-organizing protein PopZ